MMGRNPVLHAVRSPGELCKFMASSLIAFAVDFSLYSLLVFLFRGLGGLTIPLSNIPARIVSASVNFWIDKRLVFSNHDSARVTGAKYVALAALVLTGNTALITFLVTFLSADKFAAKLLAETLFFLLSWYGQREFVFRRKAPRSSMPPGGPSQ